MSFYQELLSEGVKGLTSDQFFKDTLKAVADIDGETNLTGQQKHDAVLADLKVLVKDIAIPLINLAIEVAVLFLQSKAPVAAPVIQAVGTGATTAVDSAVNKI